MEEQGVSTAFHENEDQEEPKPLELAILLELVLLVDLPSFELETLHFSIPFGKEDLQFVDVLAYGMKGLLEVGEPLQNLGEGPQFFVQGIDRPVLRIASFQGRLHSLIRCLWFRCEEEEEEESERVAPTNTWLPPIKSENLRLSSERQLVFMQDNQQPLIPVRSTPNRCMCENNAR